MLETSSGAANIQKYESILENPKKQDEKEKTGGTKTKILQEVQTISPQNITGKCQEDSSKY